jgi:tRNA threonylcarbamoyl adenosine modification protein (Sua5/YciO/YrdC/YwlC family)
MATEVLTIHSMTPEIRKIKMVADALRNGAVILYPTDTGFTLGCELANKAAIAKLRSIRKLPMTKSLTFLCDSLSNISEFAKVTNKAYKTIRSLIPGPFTFILPASKNVPKFAQNPKRKTAGIRVPQNQLSQLLLLNLGQPIISISARVEDEIQILDPEELVSFFAPKVDLAVRSDKYQFLGESSVIDMTTDDFTIKRHGAGIAKVLQFVDLEND